MVDRGEEGNSSWVTLEYQSPDGEMGEGKQPTGSTLAEEQGAGSSSHCSNLPSAPSTSQQPEPPPLQPIRIPTAGFPGAVNCTVTYTLRDDEEGEYGRLEYEATAVSDQPTPVSVYLHP